MKKKAEVNQLFVYILSVMIVAFAGFLVVKFVTTFGSDVDNSINLEFFDSLENSHKEVSQNWGQEKIVTIQLSKEVDQVYFIGNNCNSENIDQKLLTFLDTKENVILLDQGQTPILADSIAEFTTIPPCLNLSPNNNKLSLFLLNKRNVIFIEEGR